MRDYENSFYLALKALNSIQDYFEYSHQSAQDARKVQEIMQEFSEELSKYRQEISNE